MENLTVKKYKKEMVGAPTDNFSFLEWCEKQYSEVLEKEEKEKQETEAFVEKCKKVIFDESAWPLFAQVPVNKRVQFFNGINNPKNSVVYIFLKTII